jgi:DsbC/DsbD-like thiol-disulfide interchange protein
MFAGMKYILASLLSIAAAMPVLAEQRVPKTLVEASILPGWRTDTGTHMIGLHLQLAPGWKTYWRAPGEAGLPPVFDWVGSRDVTGIRVHWPRPVVFHTNGMQSIGYHETLLLPIELEGGTKGEPMHLALTVDLGVCKDICVPARIELQADLPANGASDPLVLQSLADQPRPAEDAGLAALHCYISPISDGLRVTATMDMPALGDHETVVLESLQPSVWVSEAITVRNGPSLTATVDMVGDSGAPLVLQRDQVMLTVLAGDQAVEVQGCPAD